MASAPTSTHLVIANESRDLVSKSFRSWERREPEREWAALTLLAEFAPGLSPAPVRADLDAEPPVVEMSWLPGAPLGGTPLTDLQATALAQALDQLWNAVPASKITEAFGSTTNAAAFVIHIRALLATERPTPATGLAGRAIRAGAGWLATSRLDQLTDAKAGAGGAETKARTNAGTETKARAAETGAETGTGLVLGHGDPNLANYLWDGTSIRIVDFEDSGPSQRAFELAVLVEHRSAWAESRLDADRLLARFELAEPALVALREYRRLAALYWLIMLSPGRWGSRRFSSDAIDDQARRLLTLLA